MKAFMWFLLNSPLTFNLHKNYFRSWNDCFGSAELFHDSESKTMLYSAAITLMKNIHLYLQEVLQLFSSLTSIKTDFEFTVHK